MKYFFPIHLNGGNRGCEGIAKGTAKILGEPKDKLISLCSDIELDTMLGLDNLYTLQGERKRSRMFDVVNKLYCGFAKLSNKDSCYRMSLLWKYKYGFFLDQMKSGDVMLSTGGDMMCYSNNEVIYTNDYLHERDVKTVLWGCSMGEENCTKEKKRTLENFDLVYARESLTYDYFQSIGLKKVICLPDPAFVLKPEKVNLPEVFKKGDVIGVNISNFVLGGYDLNSLFGHQIIELIDYIFKNTNLYILLIPHVTWINQDDRIISNLIYDYYKNTGRIEMLNISNLNYCQIRYHISKCRFFIGARTHAVISAYSTCVPTIAVGYSIKSKGIAKDIGLSESLVVDCKNNQSRGEMVNSFMYLNENEKDIKSNLEHIMPNYCNAPFLINRYLQEL